MAMATSSSSILHSAAAVTGASARSSCRKAFVSFNGLKASPMAVVSAKGLKLRCNSTCRPMVMCMSKSDADETLEQTQKIVAQQLGVELKEVTPEKKFADLGADSLDTVEIVMALEEHFKINVEQDGAEKIVTVKDAADVIHQLVTAKTS